MVPYLCYNIYTAGAVKRMGLGVNAPESDKEELRPPQISTLLNGISSKKIDIM